MNDSIHHQQLRTALVEQLRRKGITNEVILGAIGRVPRHLFVDTAHTASEMYEDVPLAIGEGQTISQPYTVAMQTDLLQLQPGDKVLEIGTGSGYQAAVLFETGAQVFSIERHEILYALTRKKLALLGYSAIHQFYGDGNHGVPQFAPYDRILITAAAPGIPEQLFPQLTIGGKMVAPVSINDRTQEMLRITKLSETEKKVENFGHFTFVPMLPGLAPDQQHRLD